jgi:hypothetical protein
VLPQYKSLSDEIVFRPPATEPPGHIGVFHLLRSFFIVEGVNVPRTGRCENLIYSSDSPVIGTKYEHESNVMGKASPYSHLQNNTENLGKIRWVMDVKGLFSIVYMELVEQPVAIGSTRPSGYLEKSDAPESMWVGSSLIELLKNMREWSFMVEEPFNSDHPIATLSKAAFEYMQTPKWVFDEIDSLPDMHLARFLKGDNGYRDVIYGYPQMSGEMISWLKPIFSSNKFKSLEQMLEEL